MNCIGVKDEFLKYIFLNCLNLKKLYLNGCNLIIDYGIFVLVCNCDVLEMVLIFLKNVFERVFFNLVKNNLGLWKLYVYFIVVIENIIKVILLGCFEFEKMIVYEVFLEDD